MTKTVLVVAALLIGLVAAAQNSSHACCAAGATELYAMNGANSNFRNAHDLPLPYVHVSEDGKDITYKVPGGPDAHAWELKAAKPTPYYLFVVHEWWGLNDHVKRESEKMAKDLGINVIALDLYDRKVATSREDAGRYIQELSTERANAIIKGAYAYAGKNAKVFTVGWCFGGGWSLQASLLGGKQAAGGIMFYGQPEKDVEKLKTLDADIIGFFANRDQWPTPQVVDEFRENMDKAGKRLFLYRYEADHGFANPSNPNFDRIATQDSYRKMTDFVKERMN